MPFIHCI